MSQQRLKLLIGETNRPTEPTLLTEELSLAAPHTQVLGSEAVKGMRDPTQEYTGVNPVVSVAGAEQQTQQRRWFHDHAEMVHRVTITGSEIRNQAVENEVTPGIDVAPVTFALAIGGDEFNKGLRRTQRDIRPIGITVTITGTEEAQ